MTTCATCKHGESKDRVIICHRYPPVPMLVPDPLKGLKMQNFFPQVNREGWCGEWAGKLTVVEAGDD